MSEQVMDFSAFLEKVASKLQENILLEMRDEAAVKVAKMGAVTVRREMRRAGIRMSTATGTHLGRSTIQKSRREKYGSVLETGYKVSEAEKSYSKDIEVRSGVTKGRHHVGRFLSDGTVKNRNNWGRDSGAPVAKTDWMSKARKIVDASSSSIVKKALKKSLKKQVRIHGMKVLKNGKR
jgi:hypothetical protein